MDLKDRIQTDMKVAMNKNRPPAQANTSASNRVFSLMAARNSSRLTGGLPAGAVEDSFDMVIHPVCYSAIMRHHAARTTIAVM